MSESITSKYPLLATLPAAGATFFLAGQPTHVIIAWLLVLVGLTGLILGLTHMIRFQLNVKRMKNIVRK